MEKCVNCSLSDKQQEIITLLKDEIVYCGNALKCWKLSLDCYNKYEDGTFKEFTIPLCISFRQSFVVSICKICACIKENFSSDFCKIICKPYGNIEIQLKKWRDKYFAHIDKSFTSKDKIRKLFQNSTEIKFEELESLLKDIAMWIKEKADLKRIPPIGSVEVRSFEDTLMFLKNEEDKSKERDLALEKTIKKYN